MSRPTISSVGSSISRRHLLRTGAAGAVAVSVAGAASEARAASQAKRPNIIYLFADEHRWCSMSFSDMPSIQTPNMAQMAKDGISFRHAISNTPVCIPHRGILQTGMWPQQSTILANEYPGDRENAIGKQFPSIAQTFKKAGYTTGYVGKWHLGGTTAQAGYDWFIHWTSSDNHWNSTWCDGLVADAKETTCTRYNATEMTDQAAGFIRKHAAAEKPFFLMVSWNPPHAKMHDPPREFLDLYKDGLPTRPSSPDRGERTTNVTFVGYHGHVSAIDRELGRVLDLLKELKIDGDTIVIYSSDHGSGFGENGQGSKPHPYDEAIRVPFLVRCPGRLPAGRDTDELIGTIDIYPTLCGLAGIKPPPHCGGQDLSHTILGTPGPAPADAQLIATYCNTRNYYGTLLEPGRLHKQVPFRGIRTKRHTFCVNALGDWILYDNQADPDQRNNLVNDPATSSLKTQLRKRLDEMLAVTDDPYIPGEWKKQPLHERIWTENEGRTAGRQIGVLDRHRQAALKPYLERAKSDQQIASLKSAADEVYNLRFIGMLSALKQARDPDKSAIAAHEKAHQEKFQQRADQILSQ